MVRYTKLKVEMLCKLVSLTHPDLIAVTCHLSRYVLMYISDTVHITYSHFSISFWLTNSLINDTEHWSLNCMTSMANYFTFLSLAFLNPKGIKSSPKHSSMCLSSQLNLTNTTTDGIKYYKDFGSMEFVDLNQVKCVIEQIMDCGRWAIIDHSTSAKIHVWLVLVLLTHFITVINKAP